MTLIINMFIFVSCSKEEVYFSSKQTSIEDLKSPPGFEGKNYQSDSFTQNSLSDGKFDIVWVVDDSGSMKDNQTALGSNFSAFIDRFMTKTLNFKMAITTTSPSKYGAFVHDKDLFSSETLDENAALFKSNFTDEVKVGIRGSSNEQGLSAAKNSMINGSNTGFFRTDSFKIFIIISDENDSSSGTVSDNLDQLVSLSRGGYESLRVFSIVDTHTTSLTRGTRYMEASNKTGGSFHSIHVDFSAVLDNISSTISDLYRSFRLSKTPNNPLEIKVKINEIQKNSGWTYNPSTNSIVFEEFSVPPANSIIDVSYEYSQTTKLSLISF